MVLPCLHHIQLLLKQLGGNLAITPDDSEFSNFFDVVSSLDDLKPRTLPHNVIEPVLVAEASTTGSLQLKSLSAASEKAQEVCRF